MILETYPVQYSCSNPAITLSRNDFCIESEPHYPVDPLPPPLSIYEDSDDRDDHSHEDHHHGWDSENFDHSHEEHHDHDSEDHHDHSDEHHSDNDWDFNSASTLALSGLTALFALFLF